MFKHVYSNACLDSCNIHMEIHTSINIYPHYLVYTDLCVCEDKPIRTCKHAYIHPHTNHMHKALEVFIIVYRLFWLCLLSVPGYFLVFDKSISLAVCLINKPLLKKKIVFYLFVISDHLFVWQQRSDQNA